jgi:hypothetical protein
MGQAGGRAKGGRACTFCLYFPPRKVAQMCSSVSMRSIEITTVDEPARVRSGVSGGGGGGGGGQRTAPISSDRRRRQRPCLWDARRVGSLTATLPSEFLVGHLAPKRLHERLHVQGRGLFVVELAYHRDLPRARSGGEVRREHSLRRRATVQRARAGGGARESAAGGCGWRRGGGPCRG